MTAKQCAEKNGKRTERIEAAERILQKVMNDKDFSDWGMEIGKRIDMFVNSKEIKDLQENIKGTVEDAMDEVRRSVQEAADYTKLYRKEKRRQLPVVRNPKGKVSGTLMEVFGVCGAAAGYRHRIFQHRNRRSVFGLCCGVCGNLHGNGCHRRYLEKACGTF